MDIHWLKSLAAEHQLWRLVDICDRRLDKTGLHEAISNRQTQPLREDAPDVRISAFDEDEEVVFYIPTEKHELPKVILDAMAQACIKVARSHLGSTIEIDLEEGSALAWCTWPKYQIGQIVYWYPGLNPRQYKIIDLHYRNSSWWYDLQILDSELFAANGRCYGVLAHPDKTQPCINEDDIYPKPYRLILLVNNSQSDYRLDFYTQPELNAALLRALKLFNVRKAFFSGRYHPCNLEIASGELKKFGKPFYPNTEFEVRKWLERDVKFDNEYFMYRLDDEGVIVEHRFHRGEQPKWKDWPNWDYVPTAICNSKMHVAFLVFNDLDRPTPLTNLFWMTRELPPSFAEICISGDFEACPDDMFWAFPHVQEGLRLDELFPVRIPICGDTLLTEQLRENLNTHGEEMSMQLLDIWNRE